MLSSQSLFTSDQVSEVTRCIDQKVSATIGATSPSSSSGTGQQVHEYLKSYFIEYIWAIIMSHTSIQSKLEHLSHFCVQTIGLRNPTEKTRRDAVAIMLAATDTDCSGKDTLDYIHDLRRLMESARLVSMHGFKGPDRYPADVDVFMRMFPEAYKDCAPVPSKITEEAFRNKESGTPCRQSHSTVTDGSHRRLRGKRSQNADQQSSAQPEQSDSDMKSQMLRWIMNTNQPSSSSPIPKFQQFLASSVKPEPKLEEPLKSEPTSHGSASSPGVSALNEVFNVCVCMFMLS